MCDHVSNSRMDTNSVKRISKDPQVYLPMPKCEVDYISKTLSELFPTFPHFLWSRKGRKALKEGPFLFRKADQRVAIAGKAMKALKLRVEEASQNHTTFFFLPKIKFYWVIRYNTYSTNKLPLYIHDANMMIMNRNCEEI